MRNLISILCLTLFSSGMAQAQNATTTEINEQVWKPFIENFNALNTEGFMQVHSKDVIRSPRDSKKVMNWQEYADSQGAGDKRSKERGSRRVLELRFTERMANATQAVEVGIYKTSVTNPQGVTRSFYGRFHVVLRKESGIWKILVDTDSSEGNTISEKEFMSASSMQG